MSAPEDYYDAELEFHNAQKLWTAAGSPEQRKYARMQMELALMHQREDNPPPPKYKFDGMTDAEVRAYSYLKEQGPDREETVEHPPHYNKHPSGIECINIVRHMNFNLGNALKYIWRCDLKADAIEDLKKAIFYLKDEVKRREAQTP